MTANDLVHVQWQSDSGRPDSDTVNVLPNYSRLECRCRSKCGSKTNVTPKDKELFCHKMTEKYLLNYIMTI